MTWTSGRRQLARREWLAAVGILFLCSCATKDVDRYTMADLGEGVVIDVEDQTGLVDEIKVFDAEVGLSNLDSIMPALADGQAVVLTSEHPSFDPSIGGDAIVVYRAGPFCGVPPDVAVNGDGDTLSITIQPNSNGDCDAMQYLEAISFSMSGDQVPARIEASIG